MISGEFDVSKESLVVPVCWTFHAGISPQSMAVFPAQVLSDYLCRSGPMYSVATTTSSNQTRFACPCVPLVMYR